MTSVLQPWVEELPLMQQSVLLSAVRGPDGIPKYHPAKYLLRFYRRSILVSAFEGEQIFDPYHPGGGSFTGPSLVREGTRYAPIEWDPNWFPVGAQRLHPTWPKAMELWVDAYLRSLDGLPHHFHMHLIHAAEIVGYKAPDFGVGKFWSVFYHRMVDDMHLQTETLDEMDRRLSDNRQNWMERNDRATSD